LISWLNNVPVWWLQAIAWGTVVVNLAMILANARTMLRLKRMMDEIAPKA
jgi:hypothetical protein